MADERIEVDVMVDTQGTEKINTVSQDIANLGTVVSASGSKISTGTTSIRNFIKEFTEINGKLNIASRQLNRSLTGFHNSWVRGLRKSVNSIKNLTKEAIDSYTILTEQHAKTTGTMQNSYNTNTIEGKQRFVRDSDQLMKQVIEVSSNGTTGQGSLYEPTQVSEAQTELVKAGVPVKAILEQGVLEQILTFAQANDLNTETAVRFATSLGSQFQVNYKDWGAMLDKISHTADLTTVDVSGIVQSMKYAGGITSGMNRSIDEVLAQVAMMGDFGLYGSQAGSAIQSLYSRLLTGDTTVITDAQAAVAPPNALKAFYDFSKYAKSDESDLTYEQIKNANSYTELGEISGNLRPMDEVVDKLDEVVSGLNDEEQAWFIKKFFGLYQMKGAYALMNGDDDSNIASYQKKIKEDSKDTNKNKLQQLLDSDYGKKTTLDNLIATTKTDFGGRLSPLTNEIRDQLFKYINDPNNYHIDFSSIRGALRACTDEIEERYGTAVSELVDNIAGSGIDLIEIGKDFGPKILKGITKIVDKLIDFDISGAITEWNNMTGDLELATDRLPDNLQALGEKVTDLIEFFGVLMALDIGSKIVEGITSVVKLIQIAGGAIIKAGSVIVEGGKPNNPSTGNNSNTNTNTTKGSSKDSASTVVTSNNSNTNTTKGSSRQNTNTNNQSVIVDSAGKPIGSSQQNTKANNQKEYVPSEKVQNASNTAGKVGSTIGSITGGLLGGQYGGQLAKESVKLLGGDEDAQNIGNVVGSVTGGFLGLKYGGKAAGWLAKNGSLQIAKLGSKASPYVMGAGTAIDTALGSGATAAGTTAGLIGGLTLPAVISGAIMYDTKKSEDQRADMREMLVEVTNNNDYILYDNKGNVLTDDDNNVITYNQAMNKAHEREYEKMLTSSEYAYRGQYDKDNRETLSQAEPPTHWYDFIFGNKKHDAWEREQQTIKENDTKSEEQFYMIQDYLYQTTGNLLKYREYQDNALGFTEYAKDLQSGDTKDIDLSKYDIDSNIINKFKIASSEWAVAFIEQVNQAFESTNTKTVEQVEYNALEVKPKIDKNILLPEQKQIEYKNLPNMEFISGMNENIQKLMVAMNIDPEMKVETPRISTDAGNIDKLTGGLMAFANPISELTGRIDKLLGKDDTNNSDNITNGQVSNTGFLDGLNTSISELMTSIETNATNNEIISEELSQTIQVNDNSMITISPQTTPVTIQPVINIQATIDQAGNVNMTQSQQNSLFNLLTQYNINKSRSYNTAKGE